VSTLTFVLMLVSFAVPLVAIVLLIVHQYEKRRAFLAARNHAVWQLGWAWVPPSPWLADVAASVFQRGRPGAMAAGAFRDRQVCCLDYSYVTTSTDGQGRTTSTTHRCHLVAVNLAVALPPLTLTGESRLLRLFAGRDLELESPAFNAQFRIRCLDDRYASAMLHPRTMELMLANAWLDLHVAGNALVSWGRGNWSPQEAIARLEVLCRFAGLIPPFVLRDYGQPTQVF
jgi:hypothetical protein